MVAALLLATLAAAPAPAPAPAAGSATTGTEPVAELTRSLDEQIPDLMARYDVPGVALALVSSGSVSWTRVYGDAHLEPSRPLRTDAVFRAESISKSVTAWGVLRLAESGLVRLDAPVTRYLPASLLPTFADSRITVRRLLTHTAGMPLGPIGVRYTPGGPRPSPVAHLRAEARVERTPGTSFAYSNVGYDLLEVVVEQVTGRDFAEYMHQEVLRPLGMSSSSYSWNEDLRPRMPTGYGLHGAPVAPYVYPAHASGGLLTTVADVARFVAAGSTHSGTDRVLTRGSIDLAHTPHVDDLGLYDAVADGYGLGHFTEKLPDGRAAVWHGGQGTGWMTHFHLVPTTGDGIVILTNSQRAWPLIGATVREWARSSGAGSVQMARVAQLNQAFLGVVIGVALGCIAWATRLSIDVATRRRRFAPASGSARARRAAQAVVSVTVIAALGWAAAQPYLMVSALFPTLAGPAAVWAAVAALLGLCAAACPRRAHPETAPASTSPRGDSVPAPDDRSAAGGA